MFEVSFPELVILAVVALLVLGPERLPRAARFVGLWVRRARAQWYSVKSELERELAAEDLKRSLQEAREAMQDVDQQLRNVAQQAQTDLNGDSAPPDSAPSSTQPSADPASDAEQAPTHDSNPDKQP